MLRMRSEARLSATTAVGDGIEKLDMDSGNQWWKRIPDVTVMSFEPVNNGDLVQWMTAAVHVLLRLADSPGASADGADGGYGRFSCARSDA